MRLSHRSCRPVGRRAVLLATLALAIPCASTWARKKAAPPEQPVEGPLTALPYTPSLDIPSMDRSVDPCVDFYAYSCGGWMRSNPVPPSEASWSVYGKLQHDNERFLWGLLVEAAKERPGRSASEQKIGDYFAACMDEDAVEKAGAAPLGPSLEAIAAIQTPGDLAAFLGRAQLATGNSQLAFGFNADQDFDDSERIVAFALAGGLGLPDRDYYSKSDPRSEEIRHRYVEHVARMLELLGDAPQVARASAGQVMALETALAAASLTRVEKRDPHNLHHKMTRAQLAALTPSFPWDAYLAAAGISRVGEINVTEPAFFKELEKQLRAHDLASWKTYLRWQLVALRAEYLSRKFVDADFDFFRRYLRGVQEKEPRWKRCVHWVDRDLGEALGQVFVAKTFGPDVKRRTLEMADHVEQAMAADIEALAWMGPETKKRALEKLRKMVNKIGYPDRWRDYSELRIARGDSVGNAERGLIFEARRTFNKIGKPLDRGEWQMTPPTVNAYYNPQMNDMNFPAGVLQPPLFDFKLDDAPNYGNTGATIGHELTHGFDDEGRQFDARGNLRDWWTKADAAEFEKRAQCVVDQYGAYPVVDDIKINSKLTLGEDVADIGGTRLAYLAWKRATRDQSLAPRDGFTPDQRFFVGMAQWACNNERDEYKRLHAMTDPHSPGKYRVNGVVANLPEFSAAFACKPDQPMVRKKVCQLW